MTKHAIPFLLLTTLAFPAGCSGDGDSGTTDGSSDTDDSGGSTSGDSDSDGSTTGDSTSDGSTTGDSTSDGSTTGDSGGSTSGDSDGSTTGDSGGSTSGGSTGGGVDMDPPTVISSTPSDADTGVEKDVAIVVTFSEPMDKVATQAAWQSADLPAADVTFSWNGAGDELTVTPNNSLEYAFGVDPNVVVANEYSFSISTTAADKAGNELEMAHAVTFSTLRDIAQEVPVTGKLSGYVREDGATSTSWIWVGDSGSQANATYYGYLTFEPTNLPVGIHSLQSALLVVNQYNIAGTPYTDLGDLQLHDIDFGVTMDAATYNVAPDELIGTFCSENDELCSISVTDAVWEDYMATQDLTQFRLSFTIPSDFDDTADTPYIATTGNTPARIETQYLIP